jgi:MFS family permease
MHKYLRLFSHQHAIALLASNYLGRLSAGMAALAIVLFLRGHDMSYEMVGTVAAAFGIASAVGGPVLGRVVDKHGQVAALLTGAVGSSGGFLLLALSGGASFPCALVGAVLAGALTPPLEPALRAMWPSVLDDEQTVEIAYALDTSLQAMLFVAGPLLVVVLTTLTTSTITLFVLAGLSVVGTSAFVAIRPVRRWRGRSVIRDWAGALRSKLLLTVLLSLVWVGAIIGVYNVATVVYAEQVRWSGLSGVLLAAFSAGSMIGGLAYGARRHSAAPLPRLVLLLFGFAVCTWPVVLLPGPAGAIVLMGLAGLCLSPVLTCSFVLVGKCVPAGTVTEAFAWVNAAVLGGNALGSALAGSVQRAGEVGLVFALSGMASTAAFVVMLLAMLLSRRRTSRFTGERSAVTEPM